VITNTSRPPNKMIIKKLSTEFEVNKTLKLYSRIATKKLPTIITLAISAETYFEKCLKFWTKVIIEEGHSYGAYHETTNKLMGIQLAIDLFADLPEEFTNKKCDAFIKRDDHFCRMVLNQLVNEGILQEVRNKH